MIECENDAMNECENACTLFNISKNNHHTTNDCYLIIYSHRKGKMD